MTRRSRRPRPPRTLLRRRSPACRRPTRRRCPARLTARIDPNRAATAWHIEWGPTSGLGRSTPEQTIPTGDGAVPISVPIDGLTPHTKIYWRVVASNAAGLRRSGTASFTTLRAPTGITLSVLPATAAWSESISVSGRVQGAGVSGLTIALEELAFPYSGGFQQVATARSNRRGDFRFTSRPLFLATRFRAVTRTAVSIASRHDRRRCPRARGDPAHRQDSAALCG